MALLDELTLTKEELDMLKWLGDVGSSGLPGENEIRRFYAEALVVFGLAEAKGKLSKTSVPTYYVTDLGRQYLVELQKK